MAYGIAFVCLFGFTVFAAFAVVVSLRHVRREKAEKASQERDVS